MNAVEWPEAGAMNSTAKVAKGGEENPLVAALEGSAGNVVFCFFELG